MRISLSISLGNERILPINYAYYLGSWLYHTLRRADADFADFLHRQGYRFEGKVYKLMTFSPLDMAPYKIDQRTSTIEALSGEIRWELRFYVPDIAQEFVRGLFIDRIFSVGDRQHTVTGIIHTVSLLPMPDIQERMRYRLLSPVCISHRSPEERYAQYLAPDHPLYADLLLQNLVHKVQAAAIAGLIPALAGAGEEIPLMQFSLLTAARSKLLTAKSGRKDETRVRGHLYDFELVAPEELHRVGYLCGFGGKNTSLGMGCATVK